MTKLVRSILVAAGMLVVPAALGAEPAGEPVKIGLAAMISPKETVRYYKDMLDYVGQKIGRPVEMVQKPTYDDMDAALERRELDFAFVCAGPYVRDRAKFGAELLVAPQSYGQPFYFAYIIVPVDSPAKSLADLAGKRFAFTDPKSNTGRLVPTFIVSKRFKKPPDAFFAKVSFTYSHDKSIESVAKKLVDGAAVDSLIYDYLAAKSPTYTRLTRVLEKSPPYGIPPVVVNKGVDRALAAKVRDVFLSMHSDPKGKAILANIMVDRFIVPKDRDYDSVREMEAWLATQR
jgi:phosphonate transport system substrate-binding protein